MLIPVQFDECFVYWNSETKEFVVHVKLLDATLECKEIGVPDVQQ